MVKFSDFLSGGGDGTDFDFVQVFFSSEIILLMSFKNPCVSLWVQFLALKLLSE